MLLCLRLWMDKHLLLEEFSFYIRGNRSEPDQPRRFSLRAGEKPRQPLLGPAQVRNFLTWQSNPLPFSFECCCCSPIPIPISSRSQVVPPKVVDLNEHGAGQESGQPDIG